MKSGKVVDLQLMSIECMPPVTIINKSLTAASLCVLIGSYDFGNAGEVIRVCGNLLAEIDQQITVAGRSGIATDCDRRRRIIHRCFKNFVGYEAAVPEGPQQFVNSLHHLTIRDVDVDGILQTIGFLGEPAGKPLPGLNAGTTNYIEIDF